MNATAALPVVGIDVAKSVFQLAVADRAWRVFEEHRLTRTQIERWFANRAVGLAVMEDCGEGHHLARSSDFTFTGAMSAQRAAYSSAQASAESVLLRFT